VSGDQGILWEKPQYMSNSRSVPSAKCFFRHAPDTVYVTELRGSVANFRKSGNDTHQKSDKTYVCVAIADKKEDGMDENAKLLVGTEQPPDIAVPACNQNEEACALSTTCLW